MADGLWSRDSTYHPRDFQNLEFTVHFRYLSFILCILWFRPGEEDTPPRIVKRFRGGLVFEAHRLLYHSTLGSRVNKKKRRHTSQTRRTRVTFSRIASAVMRPTSCHAVRGLGLGVWGFVFCVLCFVFCVLGFGFGFKILGLRCGV